MIKKIIKTFYQKLVRPIVIRLFRITSLQSGLMRSMGILLMTLVLVFGYFAFGILPQAQNQAKANFSRYATVSCNQLEALLSSSQESAQIAAYSNVTQKFLLSDIPSVVIESKTAVMDMFSYISTYGYGFQDIVFFSDRGRKLSITNQYIDLAEEAIKISGIEDDRHFREAVYSPIMYYKEDKYLVYLFPVYGIIDGHRYDYNPILGAVIYRMEDLLDEIIGVQYENSAAIFMNESNILYSSRTLTKEEIISLKQTKSDEQQMQTSESKYLLESLDLSVPGWRLVLLTPTNSLFSGMTEARYLLLWIMLAAMVLAGLVIVGILWSVRRSIMRMTAEIRLAGSDGIRVSPPQITELNPISEALNLAMEDLRQATVREQLYARDMYEAKLSQIRTEMLAYRSQINPHFLFNTLESVRSLAHRYGAQPVEQLVGGMSQMFRYSLYSPMMVQLEDELGHLGAYLSVMDARFPNRVRIMEDIDPETLSWPILSMVLQPLAENAIRHAFAGRRGGIILVQTFIHAKKLHVRIADNGVGIEQAALDNLLDKIHRYNGEAEKDRDADFKSQKSKISIGLPNIYHRLRLTFGEQADLLLRSREGYYTVVELVIPKQHLPLDNDDKTDTGQ